MRNLIVWNEIEAVLLMRVSVSPYVVSGLKGKDLLKAHLIGGGGFPINPSSIKPNSINLKSTNQNNHSSDEFIPKSTGLIAGSIHVLVFLVFVSSPYYTHFLSSLDAPGSTAFSNKFGHELNTTTVTFPHSSLSANLASILSLLSAVFLGFLDDVFDICWRFKLPIPVIASVPLLTAYAADSGATDIIIPHILGRRNLLGVERTNWLISIGNSSHLFIYLTLSC
ncbi:hypothetical protein DFH28DRAFT_938713 [Melampsora americana]|nr:hypothetical protein DFH28DRAFT_938713 [Melampsora americana]